MEKEVQTKLTEATKKEELPISFLTAFISKGWDEVGILKEEITAIKREFSGTAKVAKIIQDLVDAYLICIGQLELHLHNNDYIEYPEAEDANKLVESLLDTDIEIEEPILGKINLPDLKADAAKLNNITKDSCEACDEAAEPNEPEKEELKAKEVADEICCADNININIDDLEINVNAEPQEGVKKPVIEPFEYFCDFPEPEAKIEDID